MSDIYNALYQISQLSHAQSIGVAIDMACEALGKSRAADALDSQPTEPAPKASRQELYQAALNCGHVIEENKITLRRNPKLPGNALSQLADRLEAVSSQPTDGKGADHAA